MKDANSATDKVSAVSVLVIDDNDVWRETARLICNDLASSFTDGVAFAEASTIDEGVLALTKQEFHVVLLDKELLDINGNSVNGIEFIPELLAIQPNVQLLMFTSNDDPRDIV